MKHPRGRRGPFAKPAAVLLVLSLALGASAALTGCVGDREAASDQEQLGSLGLNLEVAPGITLHTVTYAITGNGFEKTGSIDAANSPTISGNIGGIPAGNGYTLELSATSIEAQTVFAGSANFNVAAGQTTSVTVHLTASAGAEDKAGSVAVVGTINVGPVIEEFTVTPLTVFVGSEVTLSAVASDVDAGPSALGYSWTVTDGVIDEPTAPTATLSRATPGTVTVTLSVSDGELTTQKSSTVTFAPVEAGSGGHDGAGGAASGGAPGTGGGAASGGAPGTGGGAASGGAPGTGGGAASGGAPGTGGGAASGGASAGGTSGEEQGALELVATAVAANTAGVTTTVVEVPAGVEPSDVAAVFVLSTGSAPVVESPAGFVTTALAAAQHNLSYGPVGEHTSLTWTSSASATTGATAYFFRGAGVAVQVVGTSQPSGSSFGLAEVTEAPSFAFTSGYALFGIQLAVSGTPTVTAAPPAPWVGPVSDGRQLFTWGQPYVPGSDGFLFPSSLAGTLSASSTKRQAQVFVGSSDE